MMSAPVDVAVAVLIRSDGAALLARRPESKVYSGYWEFPGGKVEPGEPIRDALVREIREELGVEIARAYPWITRVFVYPHATVRLHFHRVSTRRRDASGRSLVRCFVPFDRGAAARGGARGRLRGARPDPRDALAPRRRASWMGAIRRDRRRGIDTGVCAGRRPAARSGAGPKLRRPRPCHGAGRLGRLVRLVRLGRVLVFLDRYSE